MDVYSLYVTSTERFSLSLNFKNSEFVSPSSVEIPDSYFNRIYSGLTELDSLYGGLIPGEVVVLSSPPGSGKTTFCLQWLEAISRTSNKNVGFISGEQSVEDLALACKRLNTDHPFISNNTVLEEFLPKCKGFSVVVVDSIQTITSNDDKIKKSKLAVHVVSSIINFAKENGIIFILISQATKSGSGAGSNEIYHDVDAVVEIYKGSEEFFEQCGIRVISFKKNRCGNTGDLAVSFGTFGFNFFNCVGKKTGSHFGRKAKDV